MGPDRQGLALKRILLHSERCPHDAVGGKFSRQSDMASRGLPIPPFYCLTTAFYRAVFEPLREEVRGLCAAIAWDDASSVRAAASAIAERFAAIPLSEATAREVLEPFDGLFAPDALVSVRGSMVGDRVEESEDSAGHAFAGMSESFLFVPRGEILARLRQVWASGFSQEALLYRHAHGMDPLGFAVAAGVQEMVPAERSFVLFTCDPQTALREAVVVAAYGLGEGVVQEKVPCDHYFLREAGVERRLATKDQRLVFDRAAGQGLVAEEVPAELQDASALSDAQLRRLEELGAQVEEYFGEPQDIEGALVGDAVYLLQSRPIQIDYTRQRVFSSANVTESFPGVSSPLTFSFALFFYRVIFHDCYRLGGVSMRELHGKLNVLDRMLGYLGGRIYYNLTHFYELHRMNALFFLFEKDWLRMMALRARYQTGSQGLKRWTKVLQHLGYQAWCYFTHDRKQRRFYAWWEGLFGPLRAKSFVGEPPLHTIETFWQVWREVGQEWGVTLNNDTYLPMLYGLAETKLKAWGLLADDPSLLSDLLCGDEELVSVEIVLSAVRLAERAQADPALQARFTQESPDALWAALEAGELSPEFAAAVRVHLHRFGDRGLHELKLEQPSLRQQPAVLLGNVQSYVKGGVSEAALSEGERERRAAAEARLKQRLGFPKRVFIRWVIGKVRHLLRYRENSRYCRSELFGFARVVFEGIGAHLVQAGELEGPRDVFFLTQDEVIGSIDGTCVTQDLKALVALRKGEAERNAALDMREQITSLGPIRQNDLARREGPPAEGELVGLGSSPGRVVGTARLVIDPTQPIESTDDMILVARETDPGWMFLMLACKGMVVERGSMLSHTAITGRKFGIPTVVALDDATRLIPDGARIEIDGSSGRVTLLDAPPSAESAAPEASAPEASAPEASAPSGEGSGEGSGEARA